MAGVSPLASFQKLSGWGRVPEAAGYVQQSESLVDATASAVLSRGLGRSYGDASLPSRADEKVASTLLADRILRLDTEAGVLRAEAGLSLWELNSVLWPLGWVVPVSPGTQFVTLGGMVACDVHGKNHHVSGCFGNFVRSLRIRVASGRVLDVSPDEEPELFTATIGGMGLTGHILEVEFEIQRVPSVWVVERTSRVPSLGELFETLRRTSGEWPFTVCWVDALRRGPQMGRAVLHAGRWAELKVPVGDCPRRRSGPAVPFSLPSFVLGRSSVRLCNALLYHLGGRSDRPRRVHPQSFFYPLDFLRNWNRLYGRRGPLQYQCVLPDSSVEKSLPVFFDVLTRLGGASFLSIVKDCGEEGRGMLSFPRPGISVALDLVMRDDETQRLVDALNEAVLDAGGRIYLAKDALTRAEHFQAMERGRLERFLEVRQKWDPQLRIRSALSVRLMGDPP